MLEVLVWLFLLRQGFGLGTTPGGGNGGGGHPGLTAQLPGTAPSSTTAPSSAPSTGPTFPPGFNPFSGQQAAPAHAAPAVAPAAQPAALPPAQSSAPIPTATPASTTAVPPQQMPSTQTPLAQQGSASPASVPAQTNTQASLPPFPSGWQFDTPPPSEVVARANALLKQLWAQGAGTTQQEQTGGRWITYQAAMTGPYKGVIAYRVKGSPAGVSGEVVGGGMKLFEKHAGHFAHALPTQHRAVAGAISRDKAALDAKRPPCLDDGEGDAEGDTDGDDIPPTSPAASADVAPKPHDMPVEASDETEDADANEGELA